MWDVLIVVALGRLLWLVHRDRLPTAAMLTRRNVIELDL